MCVRAEILNKCGCLLDRKVWGGGWRGAGGGDDAGNKLKTTFFQQSQLPVQQQPVHAKEQL